MTQEEQLSEAESDRIDVVHESVTRNKPLSERECDRKAMLFWCSAGKPEGQYPTYREAVGKWNQAGAIEGEFDNFLNTIRDQSYESICVQFPKSALWPWLTALIVPLGASIAAVWVVLHEIRVNRESLQQTIEIQREQNRQQVLKDFIAQMTTLIAERDLFNRYQKSENGEFEKGKMHPDAIVASSLTKTVLKLLRRKDSLSNDESGALILFLHQSELIHKEKLVIDLSGANLYKTNLSWSSLDGVSLKQALLINASLDRANLQNANLENASLKKADLFSAQLQHSNLKNAVLREAILFMARLEEADCEGASFYEADLRGANFRNANLEGARFLYADLSSYQPVHDVKFEVDFQGANLRKANFRKANLESVNFINAVLTEANFEGASLKGVNLKGANVFKANFQKTNGLGDRQKEILKNRGAIVD